MVNLPSSEVPFSSFTLYFLLFFCCRSSLCLFFSFLAASFPSLHKERTQPDRPVFFNVRFHSFFPLSLCGCFSLIFLRLFFLVCFLLLPVSPRLCIVLFRSFSLSVTSSDFSLPLFCHSSFSLLSVRLSFSLPVSPSFWPLSSRKRFGADCLFIAPVVLSP